MITRAPDPCPQGADKLGGDVIKALGPREADGHVLTGRAIVGSLDELTFP